MKFRRSRCTAVSVSILLLLVMSFTWLQPYGTEYISGTGRDIAAFGRAFFAPKKPSYDFDHWAETLYLRYLSSATARDVRMSQYTLGRKHVPEISAAPISVDSHITLDPRLGVFDPRYTLGLVMADLTEQLRQGASRHTLELRSFHWADWTDCSVQDKAMLSRDPQTCEAFRPSGQLKTTSQKDIVFNPYSFCVDSTALGKQNEPTARSVADFSYVDSPGLSAGYHVFKYPGRSAQETNIAASASYLTDFMPMPAGLVLLAGGKLPFLVQVTCGGARQRVSGQAREINVADAIGDFAAELAKEQNPPKKSENSKATQLSHEDFVDRSADIVRELAGAQLSPAEQRYMDALKMSLDTSDPPKYFQEAKLVRREKNWALGGHYDWRFFKGIRINSPEHAPILHGLISAWLRFTHAHEVRTWLAHGTLLGWFWSGTMFPWDADIDVQMPISDLHRLARRFNQTVVVDFGRDPAQELRVGRYFLDIGPWLSHRTPGSGHNSIDARFIDLDSGLYIDITALALSAVPAPVRYVPGDDDKKLHYTQEITPEAALARNDEARLYNCRNKHFSSLTELAPLMHTHMEGVPAYVPARFLDILHTEYSPRSTASERFRTHVFLPRLRLWAHARTLSKYTRQKAQAAAQNGNNADPVAINIGDLLGVQLADAQVKDRVMSLTDEDYLRIMAEEPEILQEYLATKDHTAAHSQEMQLLLGPETGGTVAVPEMSMRRDVSGFLREKSQWSYEAAVQDLQQKYEAFLQGAEPEQPREPEQPPDAPRAPETELAQTGTEFQKQSEAHARDPSITRPDME